MTKSSIISKSMGILDIICNSRTRLNYSQITESSGLPKSSVHRLLSILREEGLITLDPIRSVYRPGPKLMQWSTSILSAADLPELAASFLMKLSRQANAGTGISILDEDSILWLKMVDFPSRHRYAPRVGDRTPIHITAAGKVLLAFSNSEIQQEILSTLKLEPFTHRTITNKTEFAKELTRVKSQGYAISNREEYLQDVGVAAPVFDMNGDIVAAVSMWDMTGKKNVNDLLENLDSLKDAASEISKQLGYQLSPEYSENQTFQSHF